MIIAVRPCKKMVGFYLPGILLMIGLHCCADAAVAQVLIRNITIADVDHQKMLPAKDVLIKGDSIFSITPYSNTSTIKADTILDGTGKFLVPGLVDAHVHFFQSGGLYTRPDVIDLRKYVPYASEVAWTHRNMEEILRQYLSAGITTVIDVGATINFLRQRDTFRTKSYAPAIFMTGPLLTTWEPPVYKNLGNDGPFYEMRTVEDARRYVEMQLPYKPDFIKLWYIVRGANKDSVARAYLPMVREAVRVAQQNGLKVAVHATELLTARLAVEAGATFLVHCIEDAPVDDAFIRLLVEKRVVLCPTLVVMDNYHKVFAQQYLGTPLTTRYAHPVPLYTAQELAYLPDTALAARYRASVARGATMNRHTDSLIYSNLKKLADGGVQIATGTDAGNIGTQHAASYFDELNAMSVAGLNGWQLLQASTINGARALNKEKKMGSVQTGKKADLLLLHADPLSGPSAWRQVDVIINKGVLLKPGSIIQPTPERLAQQQLNAYNAHDLDAFLEPYDDQVEIYNFPAQLVLHGKSAMRERYQFITRTPGLYCRLVNRIIQQNTVIDQEEIHITGQPLRYAVAIYQVEKGKIRKVYFTR